MTTSTTIIMKAVAYYDHTEGNSGWAYRLHLLDREGRTQESGELAADDAAEAAAELRTLVIERGGEPDDIEMVIAE